MEDTICLICGVAVRVRRGTPLIDHVCVQHTGQTTETVGVVREWLGTDQLAIAVESNAAKATIILLTRAAEEFEAAARVNEQQIGARDRFDRDRMSESKGERRARLECARTLRRMILDLAVLTTPAD